MTYRMLLFGMAAILLSPLAIADDSSSQKESPWGGLLEADYTSNFYKRGSYHEARTIGLTGIVDYTFINDSKLSLNLAGFHSLDNPKGQYWRDGWLKYGHSELFDLNSWATLGMDGSIRLPMSEQSKKDDLHTSLRVATPLTIDLGLLLTSLEFTWQPRVMKNFHEYKTRGGQTLKEWTLENLLSLDYAPWDKWSFNASLVLNSHWSYSGNRKKDDYIHSESLFYEFNESWSVGLMYSNTGIVYDLERGATGSVSLYDKQNATWSLLVDYSF